MAMGLPNTSCLLEIMDIQGKRVFSENTSAAALAGKQVALPARLSAGTYNVVVSGANGTRLVTRKILVE